MFILFVWRDFLQFEPKNRKYEIGEIYLMKCICFIVYLLLKTHKINYKIYKFQRVNFINLVISLFGLRLSLMSPIHILLKHNLNSKNIKSLQNKKLPVLINYANFLRIIFMPKYPKIFMLHINQTTHYLIDPILHNYQLSYSFLI